MQIIYKFLINFNYLVKFLGIDVYYAKFSMGRTYTHSTSIFRLNFGLGSKMRLYLHHMANLADIKMRTIGQSYSLEQFEIYRPKVPTTFSYRADLPLIDLFPINNNLKIIHFTSEVRYSNWLSDDYVLSGHFDDKWRTDKKYGSSGPA